MRAEQRGGADAESRCGRDALRAYAAASSTCGARPSGPVVGALTLPPSARHDQALVEAPENQTIDQLGEVQHANCALYRAFLLREELRLLYHLPDRALASAHLDAWLAWASRSRLRPFVRLARTIRRHREGIVTAIRLGLFNARLEGLDSRIRLISHRSFGFHTADH